MARPVTLFTGQWADLTFEQICEKAAGWGYEGLEIACWGDHMEVSKTADQAYIERKKATLKKYGLKCWALGAHLSGQMVCDDWDPRSDAFSPPELAGKPDKIRAWAIEEMKYTAKAAKAMGCYVVTGFLGSPIWKVPLFLPAHHQRDGRSRLSTGQGAVDSHLRRVRCGRDQIRPGGPPHRDRLRLLHHGQAVPSL